MKRVSIKDIARLAHVSHPTVSRALRESPLVNHDTAERIRRIAAEYGYRPSAVARSLATSRTNTVGVVVTSIADPFVGEVVSGIEDEADRCEYSVFLANSNADPQREVRVVRSFEERRIDGIIVTSSRVGALYVPLLAQMHVPIVLVNSEHPSESVHSVKIANHEASRVAARYLIDLGHTAIAYIGNRFGRGSDSERLSGYRSMLDESDVPFRPELVVHGDGKAEGGVEAMRVLLSQLDRPTAAFCFNDMTALGAMSALHEAGFRVPDDVSLVGFDDLFVAQYMDPPLTTVRQPKHDMGRQAMRTLLDLLAGENPDQNCRVPGELIVRRSTGPVRKGG
jgi:DNA-binding LacI/PurR family transcriptional regulator